MSFIVQAASFSTLQTLASDPPLEPRTVQTLSTSSPGEPLVLYIARVPGSRDVFLTPIKPRGKVVGAEDITSCLYYLHAHGPEDGVLAAHDEEKREEGVMNGGAVGGGVQASLALRENVPPPLPLLPPRPPLRGPPPPPPHRYVRSETALPVPPSLTAGPPVLNDPFAMRPPTQPWTQPTDPRARSLSPAQRTTNHRTNDSGRRLSASPPKALKRKPVGTDTAISPLSERASQSAVFNADAGSYNVRYTLTTRPAPPDSPPYPTHEVFPDVERWRPTRPPRMPYEADLLYGHAHGNGDGNPVGSAALPNGGDMASKRHHQSMSALPTPPKTASLKPATPPESPGLPVGCFTLIRRDPATGQQWNVARLDSGAHASSPYESVRDVSALEITIDTPGYAKFVGLGQNGSGNGTESNATAVFRRRLVTEGWHGAAAASTAASAASHARSKSDDPLRFPPKFPSSYSHQAFAVQPPPPVDSTQQAGMMRIPTASTSTVNLASSKYNLSNMTYRPHKRRATGISFASPWNGVCSFSSTIGNSLKCKHVLGPSLLSSESSPAVVVSELRFNLPSTPAPIASSSATFATATSASASSLHLPLQQPAQYAGSTPSLPRRSRNLFANLKNKAGGKLDGPLFRRRDSEPAVPSPTSPTSLSSNGFLAPNPQSHAHHSHHQQHQHQQNQNQNQHHYSSSSKLDLSLGQERAGGGAAGKQAKMGKLIVEQEGMKMLDLLVAANLGLWWRAYEKS